MFHDHERHWREHHRHGHDFRFNDDHARAYEEFMQFQQFQEYQQFQHTYPQYPQGYQQQPYQQQPYQQQFYQQPYQQQYQPYQQQHQQQYQEPHHHKAKLTHELIAAAAAYQAAKAYNEHCAKNGHPNNHETATKIFAAISGGVLDRMIETKGLDFIDREKIKHELAKHGQEHFSSILV